MEQAGQPEQASLNQKPKSRNLHMLARSFICNVTDTRVLIGPCYLLTSR